MRGHVNIYSQPNHPGQAPTCTLFWPSSATAGLQRRRTGWVPCELCELHPNSLPPDPKCAVSELPSTQAADGKDTEGRDLRTEGWNRQGCSSKRRSIAPCCSQPFGNLLRPQALHALAVLPSPSHPSRLLPPPSPRRSSAALQHGTQGQLSHRSGSTW